jgi:hypothetical protein
MAKHKKGKKVKSSQFPSSQSSSATTQIKTQDNPTIEKEKLDAGNIASLPVAKVEGQRVQPEQMSLTAHQHIQEYLKDTEKPKLHDKEVTAVLRLAQHLRVFGLLSAVGYLNQSNDQEGKVRERTKPVWKCLLGQLIDQDNPLEAGALMATVVQMSQEEPSRYMATWRRALILANHWNFWARAYQQEEPCTANPLQTDPTLESD